MRIKRINVFQMQRKWERWHHAAGATIVVDPTSHTVRQAIYTSPIIEWGQYMAPDGSVNVPDMDYYNSLTDTGDINEAVVELAGYLEATSPE